MVGVWLNSLQIFLCVVCLVVAFEDTTEGVKRDGQEEPLEIYTEEELNPLKRVIRVLQEALDRSQSKTDQESKEDISNEIKGKVKRSQESQKATKFNSRRRCLLPHDCPFGLDEFGDPLLHWPTPWGWPPGPQYPEYGPCFHPIWAGHGVPFGYHPWGCAGSWRGPSCHCGCNNNGWCCFGGGGGGPLNDCPQCNGAASKTPSSPQRPSQVGGPPLLKPLLAKQMNFKAPLQVKPMKPMRRWFKRYDVPYNAGYQYPYQSNYGSYPSDQSGYENYAYQSSYGSYPPAYQSSYGSDPYQSGYGTEPYQSGCGNGPCPAQAPQQSSMADQVVGTLFLFKPNGNLLAAKHQDVKSKS